VVRKSFDARLRRGKVRLAEPTFSYVVDVAFGGNERERERGAKESAVGGGGCVGPCV
jgi:hypothetical protein